jgi:DNA topoisomerase VI subunit B
MTAPRTTFDTPRAAEFLELRALQSQTGQTADHFGDVVVKELIDNALDAAESAGVPPEIGLRVVVEGDLQLVNVTDNGTGLPAEVVERILDFDVLVSDKAAYRSPTRGAQGNAFKTLLGIPAALGTTEPVVIEACGVRHEIAVGLDPGGNVVVRHDRTDSVRTSGTAVTVPLPVDLEIRDWMSGFAAVNPHATFVDHGYEPDSVEPRIYKATAPQGWTKPMPGDRTSPWWYDEAALRKLVFGHIGRTRRGDRDVPLGEFVRTFDGLSSTGKARSAAATVPGIRTLSDFEAEPGLVAELLAAMKEQAKLPKPAVLGRVGEAHLRAHLEQAYGVERFWYRRREIDSDGIPWAVEVAVAETTEPGAVVFATNYSATFGDPLGDTRIVTDDTTTRGASAFLHASDAAPGHLGRRRAAVVHVVTAAAEFTDKGKVRLKVPPEVAEIIAVALGSATKELRADAKRRERDARAQSNREAQRRRPVERVTLRDAVFAVMDRSAAVARGGTPYAVGVLPFSVRSLYYKLRPLLQQITEQELKYSYFTQTLVPDYQRERGPIPGLYYDPRGELYEPHNGVSVRLGTREVSVYTPTAWTYDKLLYVEKQGLWPVLEASGIAERYDMAIVMGQGYAAEACRDLLAGVSGDVTIFALHDADPAGYNIARTLGEATRRMPDHRVEVVDLGLTVGDAIIHGLESETFTRKKALPAQLVLSAAEREWFEGTPSDWTFGGRPNQWTCRRVELNAFSSPALIAYIEDGLARHGATAKVIPPDEVIASTAKQNYETTVAARVRSLLAEIIDEAALTAAIAEEVAAELDLDVDRLTVAAALEDDRTLSWRDAVEDEIGDRIDGSDVDIRSRLVELLAENRTGGDV